MAKEEENKDLEYDDLDDFDLEIPEIGVDPETDDRTPVRKLSTGFFQGVKDDLTDRRDAPRKLKAILPPSYSSSIDLADETLGTVGNLYNTLRDETRDGVKSVKRVARQALGKHDNKLPKWLGDRLKKMVGEGESERREPTVEEQRDDQIQNTLANIFELQVERDEEKDHEKSAEQAVRDALEGHRHESQVEQLFAIRQSVHRQVSYQDQVTARFQRKSLEMQYRQYFLTRDLFNVSETSARDIKEALQAIVKNTSLPEYRKLGLTEVVGQQFRERLVGGAQNKMAELGSGFFGRASESITKRFREKAQGWNQQLQSMAGMADMLGDSADVLDPYEMAGSTAGGAASGFIGRRLVFPLLRRMGVQNETVAGVGRDAQDTVSRLPRQINEWVKENRGAPGIAGFIADAIGGVGLDKGLEVRGVEDSLDPAFFDNQTRQSIVEIIPGYLSRIHHEIRGFREGMGVETPNPDGRMTYNLKERDFTTVEREREVIRDMIFNPEDLTSAFDRINDIIDGLDIERFISDDKVEDTRRVLSRHLMKEGLDGRDLKLERLSNSNAFGDNVPPEISAAIASAVQQRYNTRTERDEFGHEVFKYDNTRENKDRLANTRNLFDNMGNDVKDPRQTIQALLQIGGEDQLRSLGLLEYGSSGAPEINYDQVFRVIEQGGYDDLGGAGQRERREGRRYERYFENVEKLEEAKREREKEEAKRGEKEKTWFGRKKKRAGERFSNAARKMEEGSGLRDSARERAVERATAENRQLTPEQRQAFYGGTVSNTSTLYPVDVRNVQSLVETPVNHYREGDGDALGGAHRMLRSEEGRSHLKDATVQVVSDTFRKSKDRENWKSGAKAVKDKVYAGASGARAHGERLAKNLSENKTVQKVAGDERVQTLAEGGRDVYRLAESSLVIREALKLFDRGKELSKPAREALTKHLRLELQTGGEIRVDALAMPETYLDDVPENLRQELATHFERLIEKEIIQDDNLPTNLKELVQTTKDSFSENETVKSVREYVEQKTGEDSTLREKISTFQNTLQETSREVYDTNKTFQENVERGSERLKDATKKVYDRDQTPQENVERVTGKVTKASKAVYDPSLSRQENIQHHKDRFYRVLDKVYDRNLSIEDNAQRLSSKTGITRRRALKIVERFVNNLSRQEDTRDFSKATFSPTTERYRTVRNSLRQNEERTDLKRLAKEVYDTDLSVSENVRHLVNKTGVSTKKATNLIESLTRSLHGQSHNSDIVDEVSVRHGDHRDSVVSDTSVSTEKSLTTSEDREVRDEDKRSIRQQATELFNHWKKETEGEEENRSTKRWLSEESLEELRQDLSKRFSDSEVGEKVKESHLVRLIQEKLSRNDETVSNNLEVDNLTSRNDRVVDHRENETSDSSRSISRTYQEDTSDSLEDGLVEKRNRHRNHRSHAKKVEHVLSRLYRTDKSLEENARSLKRKTNVSLNKARRLVEQYTQNLTVSDDRHVRDIDLQERLQQGKEYLGESVHESRVEGSSWQNALQPVVQGEGYRVSGGVDTQWLPAQVVTDLKETINNRITRDEVKRSVNESALGEFITKITTSGRDNWTKVDRQEEVDKDVEKKPLEKLTKQLGRLTSVFRKRDGLQSPEELRGGFPDYTGVGGGVFDTPTALGPMGNFIDAHSAVAAPTTTPHVVDHQDREREVEDVTRPQDTTLSDILKDVRSILRGEEEGVGKDVHALVTHLDTAKDVDPERAQVAVLSRILENVEAIGQHITKEDEESWFNILDIGKKTGRVMSKTAGALGNFYLGGLKMLGGGMGGIGSMLRGGGRSVGRLLGNMVGMGRKDGIGAIDVYTKGQPQPTLTARGMESGEYFDSQTGDVISSVDDLYTLKGDVVDADGNLKATAGELSKGIFDRFGNRIAAPGLLSRLTDVASRAMGGIWGYMTFPTRMLLKGPQKLFSMARGIVNRVRDVYVKGERHPRILATIMKNGGYISATTGRPIYRIDQIDGEVRDRQGNVVLSHEDMRRGLVDWKGEPIGFLDRQLKRVLGAVKLPFKAAGWALGKARDVVGWTADKVGKVAGGIARGISSGVHFHQGNERLAETSNAQLEELRNIHKAIGEQTTKADDRHDTLKEVRDLLRKKIEGKQPHEWDTDGDGIRDGSWRELLGGDDEKDEDKVEKGRDEKDGSLLSTIMKLAGPLIGIIGGAINTILGKFSDLFSMLGGGLRIPGGGTRGPGPSVPPGAPAKGGWLKRGARGLWRGALGTAKFGLKWGARGLMWTGTKALPAMASFGGKALLAAGGVLASPFVLKAAAAGAVAYGGYRLYRHLTGVSLDDLGEHRMLQYGVDPSDDHRVAKMLLLEEKLRGNVSFDESTGVLDINEGGVDFESIYDAFELSEEVPEKVESFIEWLNLRFLPVYEANKKAIESNTDGKTLEDVDDLPIHQKKPFFDQATDVNPITPDQPHPYVVTTSPFGGETSITSGRIENDAIRIKEKLNEEYERYQSARDNAHRGDDLPPNHPLQQARRADERRRGGDHISTPTHNGDTHPRIQMARDSANQTRLRHHTRPEIIAQSDVVRITGTLNGLMDSSESIDRITAVDAVLLKTMGLRELEPAKVEVLMAMKREVVANSVYESNGLAAWEGSVDAMLDRYRGQFGISWYSWGDKGRWKTWFRQRFMKTLLSYLTSIKGVSSRPDKAVELTESNYSSQLRAAEQLSALEVSTADVDRLPIWELSESPWNGYTLNDDVTSLYPLIAYLRRMANDERDQALEEVDVRGVTERELRQSSDGSRRHQREERQEREQQGSEQRDRSRTQSTQRSEPSSGNGRGPLGGSNERSGGGGGEASAGEGLGTISEVPGGSHTPQRIPRNAGYQSVVTGMIEADIRDPEEQAMVMAQLGHESGNFTATEENLNYSADALRRVFSRYFPTRQEQQAYARKPEAIANKAYGGRMGNRDPGDGWKYRGRGFIQLTGRDNYERASQALGYDYVNNPDLVAEPEHAIRTSLWWWKDRAGLRQAAQSGDVERSTRLINGGTNGLQDRRNRYRDAIVLARSGEITRDAMEYLGQQHDDTGVMEQVEEQRNVQDLTTPDDRDSEIVVAQSGSRRATPTDDVDISLGREEPEEERRPVRQAVVSTASIDSSVGINEALNRDPDVAQQQRARQERVSEVQDTEDRQRQVVQNDTLLAVRQVLQDSLSTQQSMDGRLKTVVDLLREGNLSRERGVGDTSPSSDTSQAARNEQERERRSSSLNFDPRRVVDPVVQVTRRRSI